MLITECLHMNWIAYVDRKLTVVSILKDFSRSQAVLYTVKVVESGKRFKIETLLPQTTNGK